MIALGAASALRFRLRSLASSGATPTSFEAPKAQRN